MNLFKSVTRVNWLFRFRFCRLEGLKLSSRYYVGVLWDVESDDMHLTRKQRSSSVVESEAQIYGIERYSDASNPLSFFFTLYHRLLW